MDIAVVIGHPRPRSRTHGAALKIAHELAELGDGTITTEIDLATLGPALLAWGDPEVERVVDRLCSADVALVVSPTFKASYTGLLKVFLDQVSAGGLAGVVGLPLMVGGNPHHASAPELLLRPLLTELGATCPVRGHYMLDADLENPMLPDEWLTTGVTMARALHGAPQGVASRT
ncbi:NADPH-dependent FMN reductase [Aeromicrobium sp. CTD01-1L150]|uniref:NADPH-dependent FMN reductase n=1 Tax=Aeromicrobium sp. CTD01-1L150 TaxID=3341830 RepID=UPI0035C22D63